MSDAPYFERHVFFCMNKREDGRNSCGDHGADKAQKHCKRRIKDLGMSGAGDIDDIIDTHLVGGKVVERLKI